MNEEFKRLKKRTLHRQPLEIPQALHTPSLLWALDMHSRFHEHFDFVDPLDAEYVLNEAEDSFQTRRLKEMWLKELERRLSIARSEMSVDLLNILLRSLSSIKIGERTMLHIPNVRPGKFDGNGDGQPDT